MTTKHRPEWHEPVSALDVETADPLEDTVETGEVVLVNGPIDPVPLGASSRTYRGENFPRHSAGPMPDFAMQGEEKRTETVKKTATPNGPKLWRLIQNNPLQVIAVIASVIWLLRNNKTAASQPPVTLTDAAEKIGSVAGQMQAVAGNLRSQVQEQAQHGAGWFSRTLQVSPLAIGAMALVFGAGLGLAVPETSYENSLLGETRDKLAGKAQEAVQDLGQKVQTVAQTAVHEALESGKEEAKAQGLRV